MKLNFPNWGYLHYALIDEMDKKFQFKGFDSRHANKQYRILDEALTKNENINIVLGKLMMHVSQNIKSLENLKNIIAHEIELIGANKNKFVTIFNAEINDFEYVHENTEYSLGICPSEFNIPNLIGNSNKKSLCHPEDVEHFIRFAFVQYLVISLKGFEYEPFNDNYTVKFRIKNSLGEPFYKVAEKKCCLNSDSQSKNSNAILRHFDLWTISDNLFDFKRVEAVLNTPGKSIKGEYLNNLRSIYNARILGFTTKEIYIINSRIRFSNSSKLLKFLNDKLKKKFDSDNAIISNKQFSDVLYRLGSKITSIYLKSIRTTDIDESRICEIKNENHSQLALKLGLLEFSPGFLEIIFNRLEYSEDAKDVV